MKIADYVARWADTMPEKTALLTPGRRWTYRELEAATVHLGKRFETILAAGDRIAIVMSPEGEAVAALLAADRTGHPAALVPPDLPPDEFATCLVDSGAALLIVPPLVRNSVQASTIERLLPHPSIAGIEGWFVWTRAAPTKAAEALPEDAFIGQLTSGSTGGSRLAVRTRCGVAAEIEAVSGRLDLQENDRVLCASSIAHSYGLIGGVLAPLRAGAEIALLSDRRRAPSVAESFRPSIIFGLAGTYRATLDHPAAAPGLSAVHLALSAGAPLPDDLFTAFLDRFGLVIHQDYGTTETGTIAIDAEGEASPKRLGTTLPHVTVRLEPPTDIPLEPGEQGEVQIRSVAVACGYLVSAKLQACTDDAGWYHTMDAASFDRDGRLWFGHRLRKSIRIGRRAVRPEAVEHVIAALPGVDEVVVVPAGDEGAPSLRAVVVAPALDAEAIRRWCRRHLPVDQVPARVELRDELPRSPAGKVLQRYL